MLCGALLAACSGDGDGDAGVSPSARTSKAAEPSADAELKPLWKTAAAGDSTWAWTSRGVLVLQTRSGGGGLRGVDAETGEERWTLEMPEGIDGICTLSHQPNADGVGGVIFAKTTKDPEKGTLRDCTTAGAIDISEGRLLWTEQGGKQRMRAVSVGETVFSLTYWDTGVLHRFDAKSGKALLTLGRPESEIADTFHNGTLVGVDNGSHSPGADESHKSFTLYESETAKRLWSSPPGTELRRIVASDPVTLEVRREDKAYLQTYDEAGKAVHTLASGKQIHTSAHGFEGDRHPSQQPGAGNTVISGRNTPQFVVGDGVLVTHFDEEDAAAPSGNYDDHFAFDLRSGKPLWDFQNEKITLFAAASGALLASAPTAAGDDHTRLLSISLHGGRQKKLGTIAPARKGDIARPFATDDQRIYVQQGDAVQAYGLPTGD